MELSCGNDVFMVDVSNTFEIQWIPGPYEAMDLGINSEEVQIEFQESNEIGKHPTSILDLPRDVLNQIFAKINPQTVQRMREVCGTWKEHYDSSWTIRVVVRSKEDLKLYAGRQGITKCQVINLRLSAADGIEVFSDETVLSFLSNLKQLEIFGFTNLETLMSLLRHCTNLEVLTLKAVAPEKITWAKPSEQPTEYFKLNPIKREQFLPKLTTVELLEYCREGINGKTVYSFAYKFRKTIYMLFRYLRQRCAKGEVTVRALNCVWNWTLFALKGSVTGEFEFIGETMYKDLLNCIIGTKPKLLDRFLLPRGYTIERDYVDAGSIDEMDKYIETLESFSAYEEPDKRKWLGYVVLQISLRDGSYVNYYKTPQFQNVLKVDLGNIESEGSLEMLAAIKYQKGSSRITECYVPFSEECSVMWEHNFTTMEKLCFFFELPVPMEFVRSLRSDAVVYSGDVLKKFDKLSTLELSLRMKNISTKRVHASDFGQYFLLEGTDLLPVGLKQIVVHGGMEFDTVKMLGEGFRRLQGLEYLEIAGGFGLPWFKFKKGNRSIYDLTPEVLQEIISSLPKLKILKVNMYGWEALPGYHNGFEDWVLKYDSTNKYWVRELVQEDECFLSPEQIQALVKAAKVPRHSRIKEQKIVSWCSRKGIQVMINKSKRKIEERMDEICIDFYEFRIPVDPQVAA